MCLILVQYLYYTWQYHRRRFQSFIIKCYFEEDIILSFLWFQIVLTLEKYGVKNIVGIPYGFRGFSDEGLSEVPVRTSPPIPISEDFTGDLYTHVSLNSTNILLLCSFRVKWFKILTSLVEVF